MKEYNVESKVKETIEKFNLAEKKDKIVVALSGGKDSTSLLYILHKLGYNVEGLMIDLDLGEWSKIHKKNMEEFCSGLGVKLVVVDLKKELGHGICYIKSIVKKQKNVTGCTVCGIIKKYILNKWAKKLGADKIATGHNLDDETQTVLMNFLKGNLYLGINSSPATGLSNANGSGNRIQLSSSARTTLTSSKTPKGFTQRIKPLFFVPEEKMREYAKKKGFKILYERCPCAIGTYRVETRAWLKSVTDDKSKEKIVENFQKIIPSLKKKANFDSSGICECKYCGEPTRNEICNACKIFECFRER